MRPLGPRPLRFAVHPKSKKENMRKAIKRCYWIMSSRNILKCPKTSLSRVLNWTPHLSQLNEERLDLQLTHLHQASASRKSLVTNAPTRWMQTRRKNKKTQQWTGNDVNFTFEHIHTAQPFAVTNRQLSAVRERKNSGWIDNHWVPHK